MNSLNHPDEEKLIEFLSDALPELENHEVDRHLADCADCRRSIETMIGSTIRIFGTDDSMSTPDVVAPSLTNEIGLRFVVGKEIARGGMGVIFRGFDRELKREIAIKVSLSDHVLHTARFYREAQISAQLQHPGIVPVHELGRLSDGKPYIAMRLIKGQTLAALIEDKDADSPHLDSRYLEVFGQICDTMAFAHSKNVVHRDLKPDNVMVGPFGEVQIMDWGLAKKTGSLLDDIDPGPQTSSDASEDHPVDPAATRHGQILGTPAYMAPEQARGEIATKRSDVFSLGGILFHLLTGRAPFDAASSTQAIAKSANSDLVRAFELLAQSEADRKLIVLAESCLAAEPDRRPEDAEQVSKLFRQYSLGREQERQTLKLEEARVKERLIAQLKRSRQLTWFSVAMVAALVVSGVAGYLYITEKSARVAKQNQIDTARRDSIVRSELLVRESIEKTNRYRDLAEQATAGDRAQQWTLALKEIEKGVPFLSDSIDANLEREFNTLASEIRRDTNKAGRQAANRDIEKSCRAAILACCEESYYPGDIKLCRDGRLLSRLAVAFGDLGVIPGKNIDKAVIRLSESDFKTDFLLGLIVWRRELVLEAKLTNAQRRAEAELEKTANWLSDLMDQADPDLFRSKLRQLFKDEQYDALAKMFEQPEAIESMLTVHFVAAALPNVFASPDPRIEYFERAHQQHPEDFFMNWYPVAMVRSPKIRNKHALSCYSLRPQNSGVLDALGMASIVEKDYFRAVEVLEELIVREPNYRTGFVNLAIAYGKAGMAREALEHFEIAMTMESELTDLSSVYRFRGSFLRDQGDVHLAIDDFREWIRLDPKNPMPHNLIAEVYHQQLQNNLGAIDSQLTAALLKPEDKSYHKRMHQYYASRHENLKQQQLHEEAAEAELQAISDFKRIAALVPKSTSPHEELADLCVEFGNYEQTIDSLQTAVSIRPDVLALKNRLSFFCGMYCTKLEEQGKLKEAREQFEQTVAVLIKHDPKHKGVSMMQSSIEDLNHKLDQSTRKETVQN